MTTGDKAVGCCACGSVKYAVRLPVKGCVHCHCPACRRWGGAAFVTWFGVPMESLRLGGQEHLRWFKSDLDVRRGFCGSCGTPLLYVSTKYPGDVHITRASVLGEADIAPRCHVHFDHHVEWARVDDSLPRLGGERGTEPLPELAGAPPDGPAATLDRHSAAGLEHLDAPP